VHAHFYAIDYDLDLFSNFTYFLDDPVNGDQFEQVDKRTVLGGDLRRPVRSDRRSGRVSAAAIARLPEERNFRVSHLSPDRAIVRIREPSRARTDGRREFEHYGVWRSYTGRDVEPNRILIFAFFMLAAVLGFTFCAKLLERCSIFQRVTSPQSNQLIPPGFLSMLSLSLTFRS
jgi:hypothetical protein